MTETQKAIFENLQCYFRAYAQRDAAYLRRMLDAYAYAEKLKIDLERKA